MEVDTEDIAYEGQAVARANGEVVLVEQAIPGERLSVRVESRRRGLWRARPLAVIEASANRVEPPCPYFGACGGCQWQHIAYDEQLRLKTAIVRDQLRRVGRFAEPPVLDTIPSPQQWAYRNQVRMSTDEKGRLGFARQLSHEQVPIDECIVSDPGINRRLAKLQGQGPAGGLAIRASARTGETLVDIPGQEEQVFHEEVAGRRFRISASSFFQVNTYTAEIVVEETRSRLDLRPSDRLLDAYAGVGLFAATLGSAVSEVVAVEESKSAVADGMFNTMHLENVRYYQGRAEEVLPRLRKRFDAAVVDPPRAGLKPGVIGYLNAKPISRLAYISCDPSTLARDLRPLTEGSYELVGVQPVDQFPQTHHVEMVAGLRAR
ncbi:MAG: 23S rRNA (uracil(1939)-C(5))-methyltransferase RlmD [Dehalococcoidia bacterium]|nr:23S rRNA (uracil(1939)-C(5))-methyltransferase RlmD [Dehalococcoidia bacterium]